MGKHSDDTSSKKEGGGFSGKCMQRKGTLRGKNRDRLERAEQQKTERESCRERSTRLDEPGTDPRAWRTGARGQTPWGPKGCLPLN